MEEHKRDTLLEDVALEGEQRQDCREILSDEGTKDSVQVKSMEGLEGFEAEGPEGFEVEGPEGQELHEENPSDETRIRYLEEMVAQLQVTTGDLEKQLKLASNQKKGKEQEIITEQLQRQDYCMAMRRLSQEVEKLKSKKEYMNYLAHSMRNLRPPSNPYLVFLKKQLMSFRLSMVTMRYNDDIETED